MDKVYIVTRGEYSDYHIKAVFTDKKEAERYCVEINDDERCDISRVEGWSLDNDFEFVDYWSVWAYPSGKINVRKGEDKAEIIKGQRSSERSFSMSNSWQTSYVSEEHAHKLGVEAYQEMLRDPKLRGKYNIDIKE